MKKAKETKSARVKIWHSSENLAFFGYIDRTFGTRRMPRPPKDAKKNCLVIFGEFGNLRKKKPKGSYLLPLGLGLVAYSPPCSALRFRM